MSEPKWTPGPWEVFIDDSGGQWTGWPLSIEAVSITDKTVVRSGGQWPYKWDAHTSQVEAVANAHLISAAPELYAALDAARIILAEHEPHPLPVLAQALAALAKARGEA